MKLTYTILFVLCFSFSAYSNNKKEAKEHKKPVEILKGDSIKKKSVFTIPMLSFKGITQKREEKK